MTGWFRSRRLLKRDLEHALIEQRALMRDRDHALLEQQRWERLQIVYSKMWQRRDRECAQLVDLLAREGTTIPAGIVRHVGSLSLEEQEQWFHQTMQDGSTSRRS